MSVSELIDPVLLQSRIDSDIKFVKACLKNRPENEIEINQDVVKAVLNSYDLQSFVGSWTDNKYALATHFLQHVRKVQEALENF